MKNTLIIIFLLSSFIGYSQSKPEQRIEDKFTLSNWRELIILTEDCTVIAGRQYDDLTGYSYPVFLSEDQNFMFYVTIVEGHVYTIDLQNLASNDE